MKLLVSVRGISFWIGLTLCLNSCQKRLLNEDINECDSFGNYYLHGDHYISREFYDDEEGILKYDKLFEKAKPQNSICNPYNLDLGEEDSLP